MSSDLRPGDPFASPAPDPFRPAGPDDQTTAIPVGGSATPSGWARPEAATAAPGPGGPLAPAAAGAVPDTAPASADPFDRPGLAPAMGPVGAPTVRSRSSGSGMLVNVLLGIAVVVAVGGVAFAVGRATAPTTVAAANNGRFGNGGFGGPNASGAPGGGFVGPGGFAGNGGVSIEGTVTAISADSITLQLASGQTVTIPINAQTTYHQRSSATAAAVTNGSTVIVQVGGGRGAFTNGNGNGGAGGPNASGQPTRTLPAASSITLAPAGS
jgi:hypothetical protein